MLAISVIVPVYKVEQWLDRCVKSVLNQTFKDFELILVDDGSPDRCGEICDAWGRKDARVRVFHKTNGGLSDARNYGLDRCRGKYITFVDSDDYVTSDYLSFLLELFDHSPDAGFTEGSLYECRNGNAIPRETSGAIKVLAAHECLGKLMYDDQVYVSACGKLFRREMFENLRFKKDAAYEDSYLYKEYFKRCDKMVYGGKPVYYYDVRPQSITTSSFNYKNLKDHFVSYDELSAYAVARFPDLQSARRRYLAFSRMRALRQMRNVSPEYSPLACKLRREVLRVALPILLDHKVPKRDKIGILSLLLGINFYLWAWDVYTRLRK